VRGQDYVDVDTEGSPKVRLRPTTPKVTSRTRTRTTKKAPAKKAAKAPQ
jgi:hypothetical protein